MNRNTVPQTALAALIGEEAFAKLQAEFGGSQLYIPFALAPANPAKVPMPLVRLTAQLDAAVPLSYAEKVLRDAACILNSEGVKDIVVEVDATGIGQGVLENLNRSLSRHGIKVRPMALPR